MWGENENFSMEVVETEVDRMIIQARDRTPTKDHGTIPLGIQSLIKNIVKKRNPQINWKKALKIFSSSSRKTRVYLTLKRVSKRFGTRPGTKIKRFQKLAVAIDTSGSINIDDFNDFLVKYIVCGDSELKLIFLNVMLKFKKSILIEVAFQNSFTEEEELLLTQFLNT